MPTIVVIDPANVTVDGQPSGSFVDVLINHDPDIKLSLEPTDAGGIRAGLVAAMADCFAAIRRANADAMSTLADSHAAELAAKEAEIAGLNETIAGLNVTLAEKQALIDTLGATELGQKMQRDAQRRALLDAQARLAADLAAFDGPRGKP